MRGQVSEGLVALDAALRAAGASPAYVLLVEGADGQGKRAWQRGWPSLRPTLADCLRWLEADGHHVGMQPGPVGLLALDCDAGDGPAAAAAWCEERGALVCSAPSTSGDPRKGHVFARLSGAVRNGDFRLEDPLEGVAEGQLRHVGGQVRLNVASMALLAAAARSGLLSGHALAVEDLEPILTSRGAARHASQDTSEGLELDGSNCPDPVLARLREPARPERHRELNFVVSTLAELGFSFDSVEEFIRPFVEAWPDAATGEPDGKFEGDELRRHMALVWREPRPPAADDFAETAEEDAARSTADTPEAADPGARLTAIRVGEGRLLTMVAEGKAALVAGAADGVLQRHGQLVRPVRLERSVEEGGVRHRAGATVLMPVNENWLMKRLAESARWYRQAVEKAQDGRGGSVKRLAVDPPMKVARVILNDQGDWPFHSLTGMVAAPTLDVSTGRLIDRPGIDPASGLLAVFDPRDFPRLDPDVGRDGARERLERVHDALFREMPFVDEASRSVAMSALVTALVRPTMRSAPMHIFDAAMAGSGKSKMASTVGVLATGVEPAASAWASSEDENEKRIAALYRRGSPVVLFDNVDAKRGNRLDGNILNIVLTQDPASIRVLGKTEEETLNTRLTVLATGNNVVVAGDACRRAVKCRLDAKCAEPERRRFDFDPVEVARARRPRIVADLLEALSAYVHAGRPADPAPLGSFEDWTVVRGLLAWCGMADPADTIADVKATDAARDDVLTALETWHLAFEDEWTTAGDLAGFVDSACDDLEGALGRELFEGVEAMVKGLFDGKSGKAWIGRAMTAGSGQAVGDYYLEVQSGRLSRFRVSRLTDA
jgi:hypothetical protein